MDYSDFMYIFYFAMLIVVIVYFYIFFVLYSSKIKKSNQLVDFKLYRIINSIYNQNLGIKESYQQLITNYLIHIKYSITKEQNLQESLEKTIYCFDAYSDNRFRKLFGEDKNPKIRSFIIDILDYINTNYPFSKIPQKEASLLKIIKESLDNNNIDLGNTAVNQLSEEIGLKEKRQLKLESQNKLSTIISIVGIILTIFFGILSLIQTIN